MADRSNLLLQRDYSTYSWNNSDTARDGKSYTTCTASQCDIESGKPPPPGNICNKDHCVYVENLIQFRRSACPDDKLEYERFEATKEACLDSYGLQLSFLLLQLQHGTGDNTHPLRSPVCFASRVIGPCSSSGYAQSFSVFLRLYLYVG